MNSQDVHVQGFHTCKGIDRRIGGREVQAVEPVLCHEVDAAVDFLAGQPVQHHGRLTRDLRLGLHNVEVRIIRHNLRGRDLCRPACCRLHVDVHARVAGVQQPADDEQRLGFVRLLDLILCRVGQAVAVLEVDQPLHARLSRRAIRQQVRTGHRRSRHRRYCSLLFRHLRRGGRPGRGLRQRRAARHNHKQAAQQDQSNPERNAP